MKKWLIRIVIVLVVLVAAVFIIGALLPEEHLASRTVITKQSPQTIWETINDHANEPQWRSDVANVTSLGERQGKPVWQENYKDGNKVTLITTEFKPPTRMVRELTDLEGPFSGRWEIDIVPTPEGSNITITEIGKVSNPPVPLRLKIHNWPHYFHGAIPERTGKQIWRTAAVRWLKL